MGSAQVGQGCRVGVHQDGGCWVRGRDLTGMFGPEIVLEMESGQRLRVGLELGPLHLLALR